MQLGGERGIWRVRSSYVSNGCATHALPARQLEAAPTLRPWLNAQALKVLLHVLHPRHGGGHVETGGGGIFYAGTEARLR